MMVCNQEHDFKYLVKQDGNNYMMQVMEIPGIVIGGQKLDTMKKEVIEATESYLSYHNETHSKVQQKKLGSSLIASSIGIVLAIESFTVKCK